MSNKIERSSDKLLIAIGKIGRKHGLLGEIKLYPYFFDAINSNIGRELILQDYQAKNRQKLRLLNVRGASHALIAKFESIDSPSEAGKLTNLLLSTEKMNLPPLPANKYYYEEIVDLKAYNESDIEVGKLAGFFEAGEKDVWIFKQSDGSEFMLPCIDEFIVSVDLEAEKIVIRMPDSIIK
ncbi:MAG: ribosome maturation factor RimM [Nitrospinota bacterium]